MSKYFTLALSLLFILLLGYFSKNSILTTYAVTLQAADVSGFKGIIPGQVVSGKVYVAYEIDRLSTAKVNFYIDGVLVSSDRRYPYYLGGDSKGIPKGWDTNNLKDGSHTLKAVVTKKDRSKTSAVLTFSTNNFNSPSTSPTPIPSSTPAPTAQPTPIPTPNVASTWSLQSVDAMKETKDTICGQRSRAWIESFIDKAAELGANYVAISTPYESPSCGDALSYTKTWVDVIRSRGLKVWHRHMPLAFEGIYSTQKTSAIDYLKVIDDYIRVNPTLFAEGDIFTPTPEPQNGGISGVTYCAQEVCQFSSTTHFNKWLRDAMTTSSTAFSSLGLDGKVKVGYYGFDGFVAWGDNNPDWNGILEDETVRMMGNITIDHYPELVGSTMAQDLNELAARYPGVDIIIGEWGTVTGGNVEQQVLNSMGASARHPQVKGFNYWHLGPGGAGEQLINDDFSNRSQFDEVQSFYK